MSSSTHPTRPGPTVPPSHSPLVKAVVRGLRHRCGVGEGNHVLIACSGGADSVALLRAMALLAPRRKWRLELTVCHVQHHLRDDDGADAAFVEALAAELQVQCHRRDLALDPAGPGNTEAAARDARYAALRRVAAEVGAGCVATAHHADDQLETMLMAILRGTTLHGLRGIAWQRPLLPPDPDGAAGSTVRLIRPMLNATRADAVAFLQQLEQPWCEDPTNADRSRTRARLRHEVLPVLRDLRPSVARQAVRLSDRVREAVQCLDPP